MLQTIRNWIDNMLFGNPPKGRKVYVENLEWPLYFCIFDVDSGQPLVVEIRTFEDVEQLCYLYGYTITKVVN